MKHARQGMTAACVLGALATLASPAAAGVRFGDRALEVGSRGHDVRVLQSWLTHLGFDTTVDGVFGRMTRASLRRFERRSHLAVDGRLSPRDARAMRRLIQASAGGRAPSPVEKPPVERPPAEKAPLGKAVISADGRRAVAPADAPQAVKDVIAAANEITDKPYRWGGGHARFRDSAYDCSGAVSYALHGGGLLSSPRDSSGFFGWGRRGRGRWITVYTRSSHAYLIVAGARFDTSGRGESGPRWRREARSSAGYVARHPAGL
ncbi:MAG: peptidoglycan-binding protein [Thermoleophilaceae bacterium]|nr:peptidoglycan-binding protein [Thermoleophilaceae bacterium]